MGKTIHSSAVSTDTVLLKKFGDSKTKGMSTNGPSVALLLLKNSDGISQLLDRSPLSLWPRTCFAGSRRSPDIYLTEVSELSTELRQIERMTRRPRQGCVALRKIFRINSAHGHIGGNRLMQSSDTQRGMNHFERTLPRASQNMGQKFRMSLIMPDPTVSPALKQASFRIRLVSMRNTRICDFMFQHILSVASMRGKLKSISFPESYEQSSATWANSQRKDIVRSSGFWRLFVYVIGHARGHLGRMKVAPL